MLFVYVILFKNILMFFPEFYKNIFRKYSLGKQINNQFRKSFVKMIFNKV